MEPFTIINRITKAEYTNLIVRKSYKQPTFIAMTAIGLLMLIFAILSTAGLIQMMDSSSLPIFQYFFGLMVLILPFFTKIQAGKIYDKDPRLKDQVLYTFSDEEIKVQGSTFTSSLAWNTFIKREEIGKFMLLYTGTNVAEIFNKDNFSEDELNLIKSRV